MDKSVLRLQEQVRDQRELIRVMEKEIRILKKINRQNRRIIKMQDDLLASGNQTLFIPSPSCN